ncbi:MAG TPA: lipoprotein insertase outer membrane protein LolB [Paucimonas sp.]|nr:lipoprotein insertase outer membrane protein LolB [Paucimonas sp.]
MRFAAFALALFLGGCASVAPPGGMPPAAGQPASIYRDTIDLKGRLSLRYERNSKEEAMHGSFEWTQTPQRTRLILSSPLGQTLAVVEITPSSATLTQAGQPVRVAADPDALISETLGWPLPVSGLRDWLQGFLVDAAGRRIAVAPHTADAIATRDGWRIRYAAWEDTEAGAPLAGSRPKRIDVSRATEHAGEVALRIVIDERQTH